MPHVLLVDNHDSFTQTIAAYCRMAGASVDIVLNDCASLQNIATYQATHLLISPGPGNPQHAGQSLALIAAYHQQLPILGICLGHQCLAAFFGAEIVSATRLMHGYTSQIWHNNTALFADTPNPIRAMRYHSLIVDRESLPSCLEVTAWADDPGIGKEIMAIQHRAYPLYGVQYHPEAYLSEHGLHLIQRFLATKAK